MQGLADVAALCVSLELRSSPNLHSGCIRGVMLMLLLYFYTCQNCVHIVTCTQCLCYRGHVNVIVVFLYMSVELQDLACMPLRALVTRFLCEFSWDTNC